MESLRVPFVRPGESNAANRALSEALGLLPPSIPRKHSCERVAKPCPPLGLSAWSVLVKPFRTWIARKGRTVGKRST